MVAVPKAPSSSSLDERKAELTLNLLQLVHCVLLIYSKTPKKQMIPDIHPSLNTRAVLPFLGQEFPKIVYLKSMSKEMVEKRSQFALFLSSVVFNSTMNPFE